MVTGHEPDQVNPASLDVRLGQFVQVETAHGWRTHDLIEDGSCWMQPKDFVLAHTVEFFNLPDGKGECDQALSCIFLMKSSPARCGLDHSNAGFGDPGWYGSTLTLELVNHLNFERVELFYGRKIGQMVFFETGTPDLSYAEVGRYNNDKIVTCSKGW